MLLIFQHMLARLDARHEHFAFSCLYDIAVRVLPI